MRWWIPIVACAAGCYHASAIADCELSCASGTCPSGFECLSDQMCHVAGSTVCGQPPPDAQPSDATAPPTDGRNCLGGTASLYAPCNVTATTALNLASTTMTLDTGATCPMQVSYNGDPALCVFAFTDITIDSSSQLFLVGSNPVVLISTGSIMIAGGVDASSYLASTNAGAGAGAGCATAGGPGGADNGGAGGGAGGSFQGTGGPGGPGAASGEAGTNSPGDQLMYIRGGCYGGKGGDAAPSGTGGFAGKPGGAVYLIAANDITISGVILADGGGGQAASGSDAGGGGGGSGGLVGLAAKTITIVGGARLEALGAGGGGGESGLGGSPPSAGRDGAVTGTGGAGGTGSPPGGAGGDGAQGLNLDGIGGAGQGVSGGGGGGGAAGYVFITAASSPVILGIVYPQPTIR